MKRRNVIILLILLTLCVLFLYPKIYKIENKIENTENTSKDLSYNSNIIKDVNYSSKDAEGNEYVINALIGEIDYSNNSIIYLTDVEAFVILKNSNNIKITSDFGKYNINNFDTIFSKNVIINYLDNKISGQYLDFSIEKNLMIVSKNLVYTSVDNILTADVMEIDLITKNAEIFMYDEDKKVKIKSKN